MEITESVVISQNPLYHMNANNGNQYVQVFRGKRTMVEDLVILFSNCNDELRQYITWIWPQNFIASAWPVPDFGNLRTRFHIEIPVEKKLHLQTWQKTNVVNNYTSPLPISYGSATMCGGVYARGSRFVYHFAPNTPTESCRCTNRIPWYHQNPQYTHRILFALTAWCG